MYIHIFKYKYTHVYIFSGFVTDEEISSRVFLLIQNIKIIVVIVVVIASYSREKVTLRRFQEILTDSPPLCETQHGQTNRQTDRQTDRQGDRLRQDYTDKRWTTLSTVVASSSFFFSLSLSLFFYFHKISRTHPIREYSFASPIFASSSLFPSFSLSRSPFRFCSLSSHIRKFTYIQVFTDSHNKAHSHRNLSPFFRFCIFFPLCFFSSSM